MLQGDVLLSTCVVRLVRDKESCRVPAFARVGPVVQAFCRSVVTFRARTWKDAMPLVDLLRGVLMHLLNHYTLGAALLKEQAKKDVSKSKKRPAHT